MERVGTRSVGGHCRGLQQDEWDFLGETLLDTAGSGISVQHARQACRVMLDRSLRLLRTLLERLLLLWLVLFSGLAYFWTAWLPEPTSRFRSGRGMPSSSKKTRDIAAS